MLQVSKAVFVHDACKTYGAVYGSLARLSRRYGKLPLVQDKVVTAVDHVSFSVDPGEIFGVLGPEKSGKTTLLHLIAGLLRPDAGELRVFGFDVVQQTVQVQQLVNQISVESSFFQKLSPLENLLYNGSRQNLGAGESRGRVVEILLRLGLEYHQLHRPMDEMARSAQQMVSLARALLTQPKLLLLDEPTAGFEPTTKRAVGSVLREMRDEQGTTILLATRDGAEVEALCDRAVFMQHGKVSSLHYPTSMEISSSDMLPVTDRVSCP